MKPQRFDEFLDWRPTYPAAIIGDGVLYAESRLILYGRYKAWKSMLLANMMMAIANAPGEWLGFKTEAPGGSVVYLQLEVPHPLLHKRMTKMWDAFSAVHGGDGRTKMYVWTEPYFKLDRPEGPNTLREYLRELGNVRVLIIDPVYKAMSENMLNPNNVRDLADNLDKLMAEFGISIILGHHARKSAMVDISDMDLGSDDMLGAAVFSYWADTIVRTTKKGERDGIVTLELNFDVIRHAEEEIPVKEVQVNRKDLEIFLPPPIRV